VVTGAVIAAAHPPNGHNGSAAPNRPRNPLQPHRRAPVIQLRLQLPKQRLQPAHLSLTRTLTTLRTPPRRATTLRQPFRQVSTTFRAPSRKILRHVETPKSTKYTGKQQDSPGEMRCYATPLGRGLPAKTRFHLDFPTNFLISRHSRLTRRVEPTFDPPAVRPTPPGTGTSNGDPGAGNSCIAQASWRAMRLMEPQPSFVTTQHQDLY
jgi:hypothetical protein